MATTLNYTHLHMASPSTYDLEITIICAKHLKNVNWRNGGDLKPYVVLYLESDYRLATHSDDSSSTRPVWNERFTLPVTRPVGESVLTLEIFHSKISETPKPLVGSVKFPLAHLVDLESSELTHSVHRLDVFRPSGRPQGKIRVKLALKERPSPPLIQDYHNASDYSHYHYSAPPPFPPPSRDYSYYSSYYTPQPPALPRPLFNRSSSCSLPSGSVKVPSAPIDFSPSHDYKQPPLPPQPRVYNYGMPSGSVNVPSAPVDFSPSQDYKQLPLPQQPRVYNYGMPSGSGPSAPVDYSPYDPKLPKQFGGLSLEEEVSRKGKERRAGSECTSRGNYSFGNYHLDY